MKQLVKKFLPAFAKKALKKVQRKIFILADSAKPYLREIKYLGLRLFYTPGAGLVERVRFGSLNKMYEPELCKSINTELKKHPHPAFVDVGANIGLISLTIHKLNPLAKIYAFEPGPHQAQLFNISIFANRLENSIQFFNLALSDHGGMADFFTYSEGDSSGDGFRDTKRADRPLKKIQVPMVTLDEWWESKGRPELNVVKIDTEGAELLVLKGSGGVIDACKPVVFFELTKENLKVYPHTPADIIAWFNKHNYSVQTLFGENCTETNIESFMLAEDTFRAVKI